MMNVLLESISDIYYLCTLNNDSLYKTNIPLLNGERFIREY